MLIRLARSQRPPGRDAVSLPRLPVTLVTQLKAQRSVTAAWIVDGLTTRAPLRANIDRTQAIDTTWLLVDPAEFDRLTNDRGWTARRYGTWFADTALRLLSR